MRQEVLIITAADIQAAQHGSRLGMTVLSLLGECARQRDPILVRIDFPGETAEGGLEATPRRMGVLARILWKLLTRPMILPDR